MAVFRPKNNYFMDYEDGGSFGEPTIDEVIAQLIAPTQPVAPVVEPVAPMTTQETVKALVDSGAFEQSPNQAVLIDGTYYQPIYNSTGSGQDFQQGPLENVITYKESENKVGGDVNWFSPEGEKQQVTKQQEVNATKDLMDFALTAGTIFGVPAGIGEALGLTGSVGQAVGQGVLTSGTQLGGGASLEDALTAGLVSGGLVYGGSQLGDIAKNATYDSVAAADTAGGLIPKYGTTYDDIMANLVNNPETQLALSNIVNPEPVVTPVPEPTPSNAVTTTPLENVQVSASVQPVAPTLNDVISSITSQPALPEVPMENVQVSAPAQPTQVQQAPVLNDVINAIITPQAPAPLAEMVTTSDRPKTTQEVVDTIAAPIVIPTETIPELVTTGERPRPITEEKPSTIVDSNLPIPVITPSAPIDTKIPEQEKKWTAKELAELARLGLLATSVFGAATADSGPTGFDIVPVPADWKSPVYQKDMVATAPTQLPPIDFGNRNLLIGTQWEKFLDPNYGQVPAPVQFNQPSNMSYDRLMNIIGTGRDTLPSQALTINDVISGIQNQYGQKP
jgi:hypothetical protein